MRAHRVYAPDGSSHIEPPLSHELSDLEKLIWKSEVASDDSGVKVTVAPGEYRIDGVRQPDFYTVSVPNSTSGPHTFREAWDWMNGIVMGARAVRESM